MWSESRISARHFVCLRTRSLCFQVLDFWSMPSNVKSMVVCGFRKELLPEGSITIGTKTVLARYEHTHSLFQAILFWCFCCDLTYKYQRPERSTFTDKHIPLLHWQSLSSRLRKHEVCADFRSHRCILVFWSTILCLPSNEFYSQKTVRHLGKRARHSGIIGLLNVRYTGWSL